MALFNNNEEISKRIVHIHHIYNSNNINSGNRLLKNFHRMNENYYTSGHGEASNNQD